MGVSRYNSEGYYDPTAYEALTKIVQEEKAARYRPLVYICSPYSGDTEGNTEKARRYSRFAADADTIPIAPHLLFPQFLSEETERELAIFMDLVLLGKCEQLWVFGGEVSDGMRREIGRAKQKNMTIFLTTHYMDEAEVCSKIVIMDHGKIVAHDTPENLKHQYTGTEVDVVCTQTEPLETALREREVSYRKDGNKLMFHTKKAPAALEILSAHRGEITDFEVKNGTLNEVFLAITGKEIRE